MAREPDRAREPEPGRFRSTIDPVRLSKAVSHALRHAPWLYELELDDAGWTPVAGLLDALRTRPGWAALSEQDLAVMVAESDKQRYELDGARIRARYGHSVPGRVAVTPARPPALLFHGTSPTAAGAIAAAGLRPMRRQFVHLSVDTAMARSVGGRKAAKPVILTVAALQAHEAGVAFYRGNERVWLADAVPARFVSGTHG